MTNIAISYFSFLTMTCDGMFLKVFLATFDETLKDNERVGETGYYYDLLQFLNPISPNAACFQGH